MYELNFKSWACLILTGLFLVVGGVGSCMYIRPRYNVWSQEMAGKAEFAKADTDYRDRMRSEHYELNERVNKLGSFFQTAIFGNLPDEKKELMRQQLEAMRKYLDVLGKRCALEGIVL